MLDQPTWIFVFFSCREGNETNLKSKIERCKKIGIIIERTQRLFRGSWICFFFFQNAVKVNSIGFLYCVGIRDFLIGYKLNPIVAWALYLTVKEKYNRIRATRLCWREEKNNFDLFSRIYFTFVSLSMYGRMQCVVACVYNLLNACRCGLFNFFLLGANSLWWKKERIIIWLIFFLDGKKCEREEIPNNEYDEDFFHLVESRRSPSCRVHILQCIILSSQCSDRLWKS